MTSETMHNHADACNPVVEHHGDGTALVRVEGIELTFTGTADKPRVKDLDLAGWFGYERPPRHPQAPQAHGGRGQAEGC